MHCSIQVLLFAMNMSTIMKTKPLAQVEHHLAGSTALHLDRACQAGALKAGILGTFMAMISTPHRLLSRVLAYQYSDDLPVINTKVAIRDVYFRSLIMPDARFVISALLLHNLTQYPINF